MRRATAAASALAPSPSACPASTAGAAAMAPPPVEVAGAAAAAAAAGAPAGTASLFAAGTGASGFLASAGPDLPLAAAPFSLRSISTLPEHRAIVNADALRHNLPRQMALRADVEQVGAMDVALHRAHDHDLAGGDVRIHCAVAAHRDPVAGNVDRALHVSFDKQGLIAGNFALDHDRGPDRGMFHRWTRVGCVPSRPRRDIC